MLAWRCRGYEAESTHFAAAFVTVALKGISGSGVVAELRYSVVSHFVLTCANLPMRLIAILRYSGKAATFRRP